MQSTQPIRASPCSPAQLGVSTCPCAGTITAAAYRSIVDVTVEALTARPAIVLTPLRTRIDALADAERFEEAVDVRDRADALATALRRQRRLEQLSTSGRVVLDVPGGGVELDGGVLIRSWGTSSSTTGRDQDPLPIELVPAPGPHPGERTDEVLVVGAWLDANAHRVRVLDASGTFASPWPGLPTFAARGTGRA
ncbi:MAG: hypothetical protein ACRD0A_21315 [Acidimicrobiales bacterium]